MSSHRVSKLTALALVASSLGGMAGEPQDLQLQLVREGRFTYFAELDSISRDGDIARVRSLQLSGEPMLIEENRFIGGYSWWQFDCANKLGRRLDYASLRDDRVVGPVVPINGTDIELAPGGEAAELATVACGWTPARVDANSLSAAIELSRND